MFKMIKRFPRAISKMMVLLDLGSFVTASSCQWRGLVTCFPEISGLPDVSEYSKDAHSANTARYRIASTSGAWTGDLCAVCSSSVIAYGKGSSHLTVTPLLDCQMKDLAWIPSLASVVHSDEFGPDDVGGTECVIKKCRVMGKIIPATCDMTLDLYLCINCYEAISDLEISDDFSIMWPYVKEHKMDRYICKLVYDFFSVEEMKRSTGTARLADLCQKAQNNIGSKISWADSKTDKINEAVRAYVKHVRAKRHAAAKVIVKNYDYDGDKSRCEDAPKILEWAKRPEFRVALNIQIKLSDDATTGVDEVDLLDLDVVLSSKSQRRRRLASKFSKRFIALAGELNLTC